MKARIASIGGSSISCVRIERQKGEGCHERFVCNRILIADIDLNPTVACFFAYQRRLTIVPRLSLASALFWESRQWRNLGIAIQARQRKARPSFQLVSPCFDVPLSRYISSNNELVEQDYSNPAHGQLSARAAIGMTSDREGGAHDYPPMRKPALPRNSWR
jgi:hypothetical protein